MNMCTLCGMVALKGSHNYLEKFKSLLCSWSVINLLPKLALFYYYFILKSSWFL